MKNRLVGIIACLVFFVGTSMSQSAPKPFGALPSARQLAWHEMEMYGLIHFTPTTFENKEWGYGDASPSIFNPTEFDANKIVSALKSGGLKGMIFVSKHHDGFCLWPTKSTEYNISKSPFRNGKGDMVKEFEQACRKAGLKFGVYCSPWDRNNPQYGTYEYVKTYRAQLKELYSNYGSLFMSWHDGANGGDGYYGGAKAERTIDRTVYYGWDTTWAMTRKMQPMANIFSDVGWDVRWVGNEDGGAEESSWSTFTPIPPKGYTMSGPGFSDYSINPVGTRDGKFWMPAECDVAIRPGWFYHPEQQGKSKTAEQLFQLYLKSVGRGGSLDLGISPNTKGLLDDEDIASLKGLGQLVKNTFKHNLAKTAVLKASNVRGTAFGPEKLVDADRYSYWSTADNITTPDLTLTWKEDVSFDIIRLRENIKLGQRIGAVEVDAMVDGAWTTIGHATSIGSCRIISIPSTVKTKQVRLRVTSSPVCIALSEFGLYKKDELAPAN